MSLSELIEYLEECDPTTRVPVGFGDPCSYRGDYSSLAFVVEYDTTVAHMLEAARSALGATFEGYKGGDFLMERYTQCYLVFDPSLNGEGIGPVLLSYMVGRSGR